MSSVGASIPLAAFGAIPGFSHLFAIASIVGAVKNLSSNISTWSKVELEEKIKSGVAVRNCITISLARDLLAVAVVVALAAFSIINSKTAIIIGSTLLASVVLSSASIGLINRCLSKIEASPKRS